MPKPPGWIRWLLIGTCAGVSFAHGSNDGQKGVGLIMLILIGVLPAGFALDLSADADRIARTVQATESFERRVLAAGIAGVDSTQLATIDDALLAHGGEHDAAVPPHARTPDRAYSPPPEASGQG